MHASTENGILLDRTIPFAHRIERVIDRRSSASVGRPGLVDGVAFFLLYCWFQKHERDEARGGQRSPLAGSPMVRDLVASSLAAMGGVGGWDRMLRQREMCTCGVTNRLENMSICVECVTYECWECSGNHRASTDHEVVG